MKKTTHSLLLLLTLSVGVHAQTITLPVLPRAAISLFKTTEPVSFEVQTAATTGNAMTYWQGTVSINATGGISGQAGIGSFPNGTNAVNSTVTATVLSGRIYNPRVAWTFDEVGKDEDGVPYKYRSADYVVDLFARSNAPANFIIKGALVYRLRQTYGIDPKTKKTVLWYDESFVDVRASAFGPNGQIGFVSTTPD